jgi:[heparan sulfate]-glucosamine 3-sulfotransferase 3
MARATEIRPDFLIVGAMKSGTSTLAAYLAMHPVLHLPPIEIHYFDREANYRRGPEWYARQQQRGCPPNRRDSVLFGEKTPTYSYQRDCAERIHQLAPDVKLIWIFLDPVERAYSNYLHRRKKGSDLVEFTEAVATESERIKTDRFFGYVERSKYILQIERYLQYFTLDQMHFLTFEALLEQPLDALNGIATFLGRPLFEATHEPIHSNETRMPLSRRSLWVVGAALGYDHYLYKLTSSLTI